MAPLDLVTNIIAESAQPVTKTKHDYDGLLAMIGEARFSLLREATHGTHEFYRERAEITKRLIKEKAFTAVAVEADWPDAFRVNRYVRGMSDDRNADEALSGFKRFPTWMWRNTVVLEFIEWLHDYNLSLASNATKIGFYGRATLSNVLHGPLLERAIGVIYLPQTERQSHYFYARLPEQFDAVIHFDETTALEPLERHALWETGEPPETYPTGI